MIKTTLSLISILLILMGIAAMVPSWTWAAGAQWFAILQIVVGVVGFAIASSAKK